MKMPYGKFKGYQIDYIPSDYLKWVAENFEDDTIATAADSEYQSRTDFDEHWYED